MDSTSRDDTLQLLASDLNERERGRELEPHELPAYSSLSHNHPHLIQDEFNVEDFLLSRSHTSLQDLRVELRDYLATLKEELVRLINDDYEAFISLSTDLKDEGTRLERLKNPLASLRGQVVESKQELCVIQDAIQDKLTKRATLREEKALLHLLLKISESVTRLESLLMITPPAQDDLKQADVKMPEHLTVLDEDSAEDKTRMNRAKHLGRVAAEYTQLLYHAAKARADQCVFVDEIQWRINRIQSTLSSDLDHLFATTLVALTEGSKPSEGEKIKLSLDLTECFRTYDVLGLWRDAEDVLRREVVREFVKKTVHPSALTAPHSPIVPHTPLGARSVSNNNAAFGAAINGPATGSYFPRTPYTPFTAFASKQNPFDAPQTTQYLDDHDDPLAGLYNQILRFVERDLTRIMEMADKASVKSIARTKSGAGLLPSVAVPASVGKPGEGFEIMANVVWAEFGRAVMEELGGVVFAAGRPDEFRKHHEITQAFIRSLEFLAPSVHSVKAMRAHPVYASFDRRWQLPVYFQMRWKEIVVKLEQVLDVRRLERDTSAGADKIAFATKQATAVWDAILSCWSGEVYIPDLSHRFWKLTLQLISRYKTWLDASLPPFEPTSHIANAIAAERVAAGSSPTSRSATPAPTEVSSPESIAADEALLRQFSAAIIDIKAMRAQMITLWRDQIAAMLPEKLDAGEDDTNSAENALKHSLSRLESLTPPISNQVITILSRRACDALLPLKSIPGQFRAMSNKRTPTEPSHFVPAILKPIKTFFAVGSGQGPGDSLKDDFMKECATEVFENVCHRYKYLLTGLKKTEESLRRFAKAKKSPFSLFGSSNAARDDDGRDEERIRTQMVLDVNAFGADAQSLGVDVLGSELFKSLNAMVLETSQPENPSV